MPVAVAVVAEAGKGKAVEAVENFVAAANKAMCVGV